MTATATSSGWCGKSRPARTSSRAGPAARRSTRDTSTHPATLARLRRSALRWGAVTSADPSAYQAPFRKRCHGRALSARAAARALLHRGPTCCSRTTSGSARRSRPASSSRSCCSGTAPDRSSSSAPPALALKWRDEMRGEVRALLRGRQLGDACARSAARRRARQPLRALPARHRLDVLAPDAAGAAPAPGRLRRRPAAPATASPSTSSSSTKRTTSPRRPRSGLREAAATPSTPSGRWRCASSPRMCEHRLFLSATPHNGYQESFTALLEMVDDHRFARGAEIDRGALARWPSGASRRTWRTAGSSQRRSSACPRSD